MDVSDSATQPLSDALRPVRTPPGAKPLAPRSAAAQRRAMQAAMAAAVRAMRSQESRRVGWRPPPGGLL
jgi:hypothetical protein